MEKAAETLPESETNAVGGWIDILHGESIEDETRFWRGHVEERLEGGQPFSMFWAAGSREKMEVVLAYLARLFGVDEQNIIQIEIEPQKIDLVDKFKSEEMQDKIRKMEGRRVLVIARGFEKRMQHLIDAQDENLVARAGHDWDQDMTEESAAALTMGKRKETVQDLYRKIGKEIIIMTTIDKSSGDDAYENAAGSASSSDFKSGIIEF